MKIKSNSILVLAALGLLFSGFGATYADVPQLGDLDPSVVHKYETLLVIPPVMPDMGKQKGATYYEIAMRQFKQQILPGGIWKNAGVTNQNLPATSVWSYGTGQVAMNYTAPLPLSAPGATTFNYPALTVETQQYRRDRVKWINGLVNPETGEFLAHLTPVDQTLHWANPGGAGGAGIDSRPPWEDGTPGPYMGPVPMVTHVHGAHVDAISDGYPEAWWLPAANNIGGYVTQGTRYDSVEPVEEGAALFEYDNSQRPATLWYHDHTLGMTRNNVYAGPAGFWLVRGLAEFQLNLPGPAPAPGEDPNFDPDVRARIREIPVVIQDRSFNEDGSLYFPPVRGDFDDYLGPFIPDTDVPPIWNPEFFGNFMVTNGTVWPKLNVQPEKYRFRFLDGCNARFLILRLATDNTPGDGIDDGDWTQVTGGVFKQIGSEGGLFNAPVPLDQLLIAPAERADVVIDFAQYAGQTLYLVNVGPDEPFGGGQPFTDFDPSDPASTGQVLKFIVADGNGADTSSLPSRLSNVIRTPLTAARQTRKITLNEEVSEYFDGPIAALLGTLDDYGYSNPLLWMDEITEKPHLGTSEIWEIYNLTEDAHPIHLHLVMFQVIDRQDITIEADGQVTGLSGDPVPPSSWEMGWKDTVVALPGQVTRIIATFDKPGLFVWHCHIIDHEDNEMMRPYEVVTGPPSKP